MSRDRRVKPRTVTGSEYEYPLTMLGNTVLGGVYHKRNWLVIRAVSPIDALQSTP
jgi:hypothetical protein